MWVLTPAKFVDQVHKLEVLPTEAPVQSHVAPVVPDPIAEELGIRL